MTSFVSEGGGFTAPAAGVAEKDGLMKMEQLVGVAPHFFAITAFSALDTMMRWKKMIIGIDVDAVLRDFVAPTLKWWERMTGIRKYREDINEWDVYECLDARAVGLSLRQFYEGWFGESRIWRDAPPILGAIDNIVKLHKTNEIVIITDQPTLNQKIWTLEWLNEHLRDMYYSPMFTDKKGIVRADVLIDDGSHNFEGFTGRAILFSQPWNQNDNRHTRIYGWDDPVLFDTLSSMGGERR